jgi:histidinol dehydrogenase
MSDSAMRLATYNRHVPNDALDKIRSRSVHMNPDLVTRVAQIVEGVRSGGDEALVHYSKEFDGVSLSPADLRVEEGHLRELASRADQRALDAFRKGIRNVRLFHERQRESPWSINGEGDSSVGQRILPISSAGLYVPGGRAAYPSTVVMSAVPAQIAGVPRICVATPPQTLDQAPLVAAVLVELGITEAYRIGGAQAVAALAFGTETIPRVDKIVGPGNVYVAIAKKLVYGSVGIDSIAGPTEVVILADESAEPRFVAADLLAQAEHDTEASAICITTSGAMGERVAAEVERQLAVLERRQIASASLEKYGAVFVVGSVESACELINEIAPEHLELMTADNDSAAALIQNAGAIFFGEWSSEPVGDYLAGPNHVLPTLGTSRFSSPLGVYDFLKRQSVIRYTREAIALNADSISAMAEAEGLTAHKRAVRIRTEEKNK